MAKKYKVVRPKSLNDSEYENFEYLIGWTGRDGAVYQYMFYDAEFMQRVRNTIINAEDSDRIENLIDKESRTIELTADNLTKNDLLIIAGLLASKYVLRIKKDGTTERYAPDSNKFKYRLMNYRYKVTFSLMLSEVNKWR